MRRTWAPILLAVLAAAPSAANDYPLGEGSWQKLSSKGDKASATYGFNTPAGDAFELSFSFKKADLATYESSEWGYSPKEIDALKTWLNKSRQEALNKAVAKGWGQEQLDAEVKKLQAEYKTKLNDYLSQRGFVLDKDNSVRANVPGLVARNTNHLRSMAADFDALVQKKKYDWLETAGAAASMMQTALYYKQPDLVMEGRNTGGVLPPVMTLLRGWGDCDTKTAALGAMLKNYPKAQMVGVAVPGHYLIGVLANPAKGDMFVEHDGQRYVLIEPAGPAFMPPGRVGPDTEDLLRGNSFRIEPF